MRDFVEAISKAVGGLVSAGTVWIAEVSHLGDEVKVLAGFIGCMVSAAFFVSLCFDIRRKWRNRNVP